MLLGLAVLAGSANAATIPIADGGTYKLLPGNLYNDGSLTPGEYSFEVDSLPGLPMHPVVWAAPSNLEPPAQNLKITWLLNNASIGFDAVSVAANEKLYFPAVVLGTYKLIVDAVVGGNYSVNLLTTTPLPPALILFGTALAGLSWLGRRRRPA
jgi:uncharacterized protein (TIGR03382 family)